MIEERLIALNNQYDNAIAIFGGAIWAYEIAKTGNLDEFIPFLDHVIQTAKFYHWHESIPTALRRFCHLCLVDPTLIEAYLGIKFEEVV